MQGFEFVDTLDVIKPGRPASPRAQELESIITQAKDAGAFGIKIELAEDEQAKFYRFSQRVRLVAKRLGYKVNVSVVPGDEHAGYVRLLDVEE